MCLQKKNFGPKNFFWDTLEISLRQYWKYIWESSETSLKYLKHPLNFLELSLKHPLKLHWMTPGKLLVTPFFFYFLDTFETSLKNLKSPSKHSPIYSFDTNIRVTNSLLTPFILPWNTLEFPWNTLQISLKYLLNFLWILLKLPWKTIETPFDLLWKCPAKYHFAFV